MVIMNWYKKANWEVDDSSESLDQEQWDAQGEVQQFLGPNDKTEDLFRKEIELVPIKDIVSSGVLEGIKLLIEKQGKHGRETVDNFKKAILNGEKLPPVTIKKQYDGSWKLISGRHRLLAALELGSTMVPAIKMEWIT